MNPDDTQSLITDNGPIACNERGDPVIFNRVAYLPYLDQLEREGVAKHKTWRATFQGGSVVLHLHHLDMVLFYGTSGEIPVFFLSDASDTQTGVIFHTRHKRTPLTLVPATRPDRNDLLTDQILARSSARKRLVIAKALVTARVRQMGWLLPHASDDAITPIRKALSVDAVRLIEAHWSERYWLRYFEHVNHADLHRREKNFIAQALDALSAFTAPLYLRWLIVHGLSPHHGYLHQQTGYESLVYDLMETTRHWMEQVVFELVHEGCEADQLTAMAVKRYQAHLEIRVEIPSIQVTAKRKFVLYGMVLALRAYLKGDMNHVNFPLDHLERSRGRPVKVSYQIPGAERRRR
jgi:CRISPR/Cas system-associated endonuclease Cas1